MDMDMSTTMATATSAMNMSATTTSAMSMATTTDSSMTSSMMMGMDEMAMTFFTSTSTSLYSMSWTPSTTGQYAATCIFLIAFAAILRALLAFRCNFSYILATTTNSYNDGGLAIKPYRGQDSAIRPWRARESILTGFMDAVLAGIGYLLCVSSITFSRWNSNELQNDRRHDDECRILHERCSWCLRR